MQAVEQPTARRATQCKPDALHKVIEAHGASGIGGHHLGEAFGEDAAATGRDSAGEFAHLQ